MLKKMNTYFINVLVKTRFGMPQIVQVFLMLLSSWWAFVLYLPSQTFAISSAYKSMLFLAIEPVWATLFLLMAAIQLIALIKNSKRLSLYGLMISTVVWLFVGTMMLIAAAASTGSGIYLLVGLLSASTYFYMGVDRS